MTGDPVGYEATMRVAGDENLHRPFDCDLASAAIELDPHGMMVAIEGQVTTFAMPGLGILGFDEHARKITAAGICDLTVHHEQILVSVVTPIWDVENVTGLAAEGEQPTNA